MYEFTKQHFKDLSNGNLIIHEESGSHYLFMCSLCGKCKEFTANFSGNLDTWYGGEYDQATAFSEIHGHNKIKNPAKDAVCKNGLSVYVEIGKHHLYDYEHVNCTSCNPAPKESIFMAILDPTKSEQHNHIKTLIANLIPGVPFELSDTTAYYIHSLNGTYRDIAIYQEALGALIACNKKPDEQKILKNTIKQLVQQVKQENSYNNWEKKYDYQKGSVIGLDYGVKYAEKNPKAVFSEQSAVDDWDGYNSDGKLYKKDIISTIPGMLLPGAPNADINLKASSPKSSYKTYKQEDVYSSENVSMKFKSTKITVNVVPEMGKRKFRRD